MDNIFDEEWLFANFPPEKTEEFFEALFGGAEEGAYDISLHYDGHVGSEYKFFFMLTQRPGKCLACNLTQGLPLVFSRHPIINAAGIAQAVALSLGKDPKEMSWKIGKTEETSPQYHTIPLIITVA